MLNLIPQGLGSTEMSSQVANMNPIKKFEKRTILPKPRLQSART